MRIGVAVLAALACGAPAARAQVAIAPVVQSDDAVQRDVVGGIALALAESHTMLSPQLALRDVVVCRDDVACMVKVARDRGASHLVVVSAAPLGTRDQVVAVSVHAVQTGERLFEENAVLSTTRDVRAEAQAIGARVAAVKGVPRRPPPAAAEQAPGAPAGAGVLSFVGVGLLGGSALALVVTGVASSLSLSGTNPDPRGVGPLIVGGSVVTGVLALSGLTLLVLDE